MQLRDIVVLLDASPASEARMHLATRIAREHGAHLSAVFVRHDRAVSEAPDIAVGHGLTARLMAPVAPTRQRTDSADESEQRLRECLHRFVDDSSWHTVNQSSSTELTAFTRTADLIILGQNSRNIRPGPPWRPHEIVVDSGCPVLVIPHVGTFTELGRRVLIAWDGSRESARTLHDALPVIRNATTVSVMTVCTRDGHLQRDRDAVQRVVLHLARHDILPARADHLLRDGDAISDLLLSAAMDISADLIVAGAYHRSPLREALTGGVSRELLQHMTVPVLMSH